MSTMIPKTYLLQPLTLALLLATAGAAQATITVYTTLASFTAATSALGTDTYTGFSITATTPSPITRAAGAYGYTASTPNNFFGAGTTADPWLSSNVATDTLTFNSFGGGAQAIGGNFFGTNIAGNFLAGSVTLTVTDSSGPVTRTISNATVSSFLGFVSSSAMIQMTLSAVQSPGVLYPTLDNLVLARNAAPVPEPQTYALMLAGMGVVGLLSRRRRA
jgi:hypothetical protein